MWRSRSRREERASTSATSHSPERDSPSWGARRRPAGGRGRRASGSPATLTDLLQSEVAASQNRSAAGRVDVFAVEALQLVLQGSLSACL